MGTMIKIVTFLIVSLNILQIITVTSFYLQNYSLTNDSKMENRTNLEDSIRNSSIRYLPNYIRPIHYNIKLILIDNTNFYGDVNVSLIISKNTRNISFHSDRLGVNYQAITLTTGNNGTTYTPVKYSYDIESQINNIYFNHWLPRKQYYIFIKFTGIISNNPNDKKGFYISSHITNKDEKAYLLATLFQGIGARRVFPCWDEPSLNATFEIKLKHFKNYIALSNVLPSSRDVVTNELAWTYMNISHKISPYQIAIVLYNFSSFHLAQSQENKLGILHPTFVNRENTMFALSIAEIVTQYLRKSEIKEWWPIHRQIHIAIPNFPVESVENNALALYRLTDFTYDPKVDTILQKLEVARSISRKVLFHWLSNAFSPVKWSYLWITQGLCTLLGMHALAQKSPKLRVMDYSIVQMRHDSLHLDTHSVMNPLLMNASVNEIESIFSSQYYLKAFLIFRMIQSTVTGNVFWYTIKQYLNEQTLHTSITDERPYFKFWNYIQEAMKKFNVPNLIQIPLYDAIYVWTTSLSYPILNVIQDYETGDMTIKVMPNPSATEQNTTWYIYVSYATESYPDFIHHEPTYKTKWITPSETNITIATDDVDDWVIVNVRQIGYYRIQYERRNWKRLARYLKQCNFDKIHVLNRAQLIDDAFHFTMQGQLDFSLFMDLTEFLGTNEKDYIVWYPMIKAFEYMSVFFPYPASQKIQAHIYNILHQLLYRIKYEQQPNEDEFIRCLRQEALKWSFVINDVVCKKKALKELNNYLLNRENYEFLPGLKDWTFCNGLKYANLTIWNQVLEIWILNRDKKFLEYLACSEDPDIIINYLNLSSYKGHSLQMTFNDYFYRFAFIIARHAKKNKILDFILNNFHAIIPRQFSNDLSLNILFNYVYSEEQINLICGMRWNTTMVFNMHNIQDKKERRIAQIKEQVANLQRLITDY